MNQEKFMKKKIITGGCSFTFNKDSWAYHIPDVINVARGGSGPVTSIREVLVTLRETQGDKICIFQVSNPSRQEILVTNENNHLFFKHTVQPYDDNICGTNYYHVRGFGGTTTEYNYKRLSDPYIEVLSQEQKAVECYEMLTLLQLYCEKNKIPLLIFYGWLDNRYIQGELIQKILQGIDWTVWWKQGKETMSSWLKENGFTDKTKQQNIGDFQNKLRPTSEAHEYFYKEVIAPWIADQ